MTRKRAEFDKPTKRAALKRSEGECEAEGIFYGMMPGVRCRAPLAYGVEFDHLILEANSHDNRLENCRAVCPDCHARKTRHRDIPLAAKTLRQQDKHNGITGPKQKIKSRNTFRPFQSNTRHVEHFDDHD